MLQTPYLKAKMVEINEIVSVTVQSRTTLLRTIPKRGSTLKREGKDDDLLHPLPLHLAAAPPYPF